MATKEQKERGKDLNPVDALNEKLDEITENGMEITKKWSSMWSESIRLFFNDQLHSKKLHKDWEWVILNYIWPSAMQEIAKMSRNHPKIIASAWEVSDTDAAEVWQSHLQWMWENGINGHGMRLEQIYALMDAKLFGYRVSKIFWEDKISWDDENKVWQGDVKHRLWHPVQFWADGGEKIEDGNCGTERFVRLDWAQAQWPDSAEELEREAEKEPDFPPHGLGGLNIRGQSSGDGYTSGAGGTDPGLDAYKANRLLDLIQQEDKITKTRRPKEKIKVVKLQEIYLKDYEEIDQKQEEPVPAEELLLTGRIYEDDGYYYDGKTDKLFPESPDTWPTRVAKKWKQPKYPQGRHIIRVGKTILIDRPYPHKQWPFVVIPHYLLPHMWQGSDGVQMYKSVQDMINISVSHLFNNMKFYGDPKIMVETGAVEVNPRTKKAFKIGAAAGSIIRLVKGAIKRQAVKVVDPPSVPVAATQLYQLFSQEFKNLVGLQSISKGEKEPGEMSATQAQWLALSSVDRIQLQSVFEDEWIRRACNLIAEICQANYEPERYIRIVGEDRILGVQQITQHLKEIRFDVNILPATTLPYDEDKRLQKHLTAYQLLGQPVPNPMLPELLRDLEVANWKKLLQQHKPWILWTQFLQLYQGIASRQIDLDEGLRVLTERAVQEFGQQQRLTPRPSEEANVG